MDVSIRETNETDLQLVRRYTIETAWTTVLSESDRKDLVKEQWTKHIPEAFEKLAREDSTDFMC